MYLTLAFENSLEKDCILKEEFNASGSIEEKLKTAFTELAIETLFQMNFR